MKAAKGLEKEMLELAIYTLNHAALLFANFGYKFKNLQIEKIEAVQEEKKT